MPPPKPVYPDINTVGSRKRAADAIQSDQQQTRAGKRQRARTDRSTQNGHAATPSTPQRRQARYAEDDSPGSPAWERQIAQLHDNVTAPIIWHRRDTSDSPSTQSRTSIPKTTPAAAEIERLRGEMKKLRSDMAALDRQAARNELRIRQDMMLDLVKEREKRETVEKDLMKLKSHVDKLIIHYQSQIKGLQTNVQNLHNASIAAREEAERSRADAGAWRSNADRLQTENNALQDDLDELRKIENEEAAKRRHNARGLPPPYGDLDDAAYAVPWERHVDNGPLSFGTLKQTVLKQFNSALAGHQKTYAALLRGSEDDAAKAGPGLIVDLSIALDDGCRCLLAVLEGATQLHVAWTKHIDLKAKAAIAAQGLDDVQIAAKTSPEKAEDHVARKTAKLIIELCWRVIGILEIRPTNYSTNNHYRTKLGLSFSKIDDQLLESVKAVFRRKLVLSRLQYYVAQIRAIKDCFWNLNHNVPYYYFEGTLQWLDDNVEKQRQMEANLRPRPTEPTVITIY